MPPGKEKRRFKRYRRRSAFRLSIGGNTFQANTIDFSLGGLGFSVEDTPSLTEGSIIDLKIDDLNLDIYGKIVWSQKVNQQFRVGIERKIISGLLKHYPLPDILLGLQRSEKSGIFEIYRGIKKINNLTHIKNAMPPLEAILHYSTDPINLFQDINLDNKDKDILSLIDGRRNIHEFLSISPSDNFQTLKTLYALISTRIIEPKEKESTEDKTWEEIIKEPKIKADSAFIEKVEDLYKRLESTNYYDILDIEKWATQDKLKKAYYNVAKEFHPDIHFYIPSDTLKNKLNTIFSHITAAYKILSDPKMRREYDNSLSIKPAKTESNNIEIARTRFKEGKEAFRKRSYAEAAELFGQAAYLDGSVPDYHFNMGLALEKAKRLREAEKALQQALKIAPYNANYLAELGHIYLQLDLKLRAKTTFEKAIKFDPSNERAVEGLQKVRNHS